MKKVILTSAIVLLAIFTAFSQSSPEPADVLVKNALKQAKKEKKNVMVIFHASWCGWCKKFDASINDPSCKAYFDKNFVFVHLTVLESADKKNLENPGAEQMFNDNGGKGSGIPFFLIYGKDGKLLTDSKMKYAKSGPEGKLSNMGCPAQDEEIAAFVEKLRTCTKISDAEIAAIKERFSKNRS